MCWWQFGFNDEWTPESIERHGFSVKIRSIQEVVFVCICVGLFISWENPFEEDNASNFDPSLVLISLDYQDWHLALKSPVIIDNSRLWLFISLASFQRLDKNESILLLLWLGERQITDIITIYCGKSFLKAMLLKSKINLWL